MQNDQSKHVMGMPQFEPSCKEHQEPEPVLFIVIPDDN